MSLPPSTEIPQQLAAATIAWKKMRRLASYALFDGWSLTMLGALTLICGGYGSAMGLLVSFGLLGTGIFELRSVSQLRRLNPSAINHLAYNQLVLAGALIAYALINLIQTRNGGGMLAEIQQELGPSGAADDFKAQAQAASEIWYAGLIAFAVLVQGGTALYYFSRRTHLQRYLADTPDWIQQMQRERGEVSL
jgi:cytochrome b